ncbi:hypothetical protein [Bartonella sp. AU18XJBT]|uniref:hypothetical protein n=1 Tax=Bartonella sp. AU18XJBT TaxID=3019089 RepID=UPI0023608EF0|nr:hypothetical protein [Bartonella sp. AU18XJBT]
MICVGIGIGGCGCFGGGSDVEALEIKRTLLEKIYRKRRVLLLNIQNHKIFYVFSLLSIPIWIIVKKSFGILIQF